MRNLLCFALLLAGCGANSDPASDHPPSTTMPTPQDDGGTPPPPPPAVTDDAGAGQDASCGGQQFDLMRVPPNVMLVLDRSGSMDSSIGGGSSTSKWSDLKSAIQQLVTTYDAQMRLGVSLYSSDGNCGAGDITPYAQTNGATVMSKINAKGPGGNTPTAATLDKVLKMGQLTDPTRENVVVLATDGLPNCSVAGKINALYNATPSVKTYVIGVGDGTASNPTLLNAWADAGHTARSGATHYYQTNSPTELKAAFDAIAGGIVSCTFQVGQQPPDPSQLYVWSNGTPVAMDAMNGFTYDASSQSVTLHGTACDQLRMNPSTKVQVVYGCPAPPPIN
jgi:hypothetical protein